MFEIKDGYNPELKTPETIWQHKKIIEKRKNGENTPRLKGVEVVLVQYIVNKQYQQKPEVLYTFRQIDRYLLIWSLKDPKVKYKI